MKLIGYELEFGDVVKVVYDKLLITSSQAIGVLDFLKANSCLRLCVIK